MVLLALVLERWAMSEILKAWEKIKSLTWGAVIGKISPDLSGGDEKRIKKRFPNVCLPKAVKSPVDQGLLNWVRYLNLSKKGWKKSMIILVRGYVKKGHETISRYNGKLSLQIVRNRKNHEMYITESWNHE